MKVRNYQKFMKNLEKNDLPFVSIIIPCRNEEKFIGKCLDSIIAQDYPKDKLEVLVVDGRSTDRTREIVKEYQKKHSFIRLLDNPHKVTPKAMNIGIKNSKGEVILLVNAHSILDKEFLKWNSYFLNKFKDADAVGGTLKAVSIGKGIVSKSITLITDSIFGSGGRRYRTRTKEGFVRDTLPSCAYRRRVFEKIGHIDEELLRGQDAEFNYRLLRKEGRLYFSPKIKSYAYARSSFPKLWQQQFQYGYFKVKMSEKIGHQLILRQHIPAIFVLSLVLTGILGIFLKLFFYLFLLIIGLYFLLDVIFSLQISFKNGFKYFFTSMISFFLFHFSYGIGYLKGIWDFIILERDKKKRIKDMPLTR